jgi:hypothetical protein
MTNVLLLQNEISSSWSSMHLTVAIIIVIFKEKKWIRYFLLLVEWDSNLWYLD